MWEFLLHILEKNSTWSFFLLEQCSLGKEVTAARKAKLVACKRSGTSEGTSNTDFTRGKLLLHKNQICRDYKHCRTAVHKMKYFLKSVYYLFDVKKWPHN